jgi:DNA-binding NtrC family response regulator
MKPLVLVVDDETGVREAISMYLEIEGIDAISAKSGSEAVKLIKENSAINFVISDVRMPNGDGIFLIKELRKINKTKPYIILISGQADISKEEAILLGAQEMFIKPPNMDKIISLIYNTHQEN